MIVCVKPLDCLVTVNVCAVPSVPFDAASVDFRGMAVNVFDADAVTVPLLVPVTKDAEHESVFFPSALCDTLTVFVNNTLLPLDVLLSLNVLVKLYDVPSIFNVPAGLK